MRALITGVLGFAGSHLAEHLLAAGDEVLGCAKTETWPAGLAHLAPRVPLVAWNVAEQLAPDAERRVAEFAPQCIYHLAALSLPGPCETAPALAQTVNVEGTRRVAELASRLPGPPRLLVVSSSSVYGPARGREPVDELAVPGPVSVYARSKLAAESAARLPHVPLIIARAFHHCGPRQPAALMLAEWARQLVDPQCRACQVKSLATWLDLTDVRDTVRAYRLLAERGTPGEIYNVGSGRARRSGEILADLMTVAGRHLPAVELQTGDPWNAIANITRLHQATNWRPEIAWNDTLRAIIEYWRAVLGN